MNTCYKIHLTFSDYEIGWIDAEEKFNCLEKARLFKTKAENWVSLKRTYFIGHEIKDDYDELLDYHLFHSGYLHSVGKIVKCTVEIID